MILIFRSILLAFIFWGAIRSIHYANLANINFGIVSCCFIVSVVVNTAAGLAFFKETFNIKVLVGIIVTLSGIMWISLAKGSEAIKLKHEHEARVETIEDI